MIRHPRTATEWKEVIEETTINGVGIGMISSTSFPLRIYPDSILTQISEPVPDEEFGTDNLARLCERMHFTMFVKNGVGLSAVQVGQLKQVITMKIPETVEEDGKTFESGRPYTFINPEIRERTTGNGNVFKFSEGCLSVPDYYEERERSNAIMLRFQTIHGDAIVTWFEGLEAFIIQHEMDHLEGKLFIDDLSPLKKDRIRKKIRKTLRRK